MILQPKKSSHFPYTTLFQSFFFTGFGKGDEIADYSLNFRTDGTTVRSTSYNFYGTNQVRASAADIENALRRTDTFKANHESDTTTKLQSKTFFFTGFGKGDE